jgi:hypothetical protein
MLKTNRNKAAISIFVGAAEKLKNVSLFKSENLLFAYLCSAAPYRFIFGRNQVCFYI